MKYSTLKKLIGHDMNPAKYDISPAEVEFWLEILPEINEELFYVMDFMTNVPFGQSAAKNRINKLQAEHVTLLNAVGKIESPRTDVQKLSNALCVSIEGVLSRIDEQYSDYTHQDNNVASATLNKLAAQLKKQKLNIMEGLASRKVDNGLLQVMSQCFDEFCRMKRCNYRKLYYINDLMYEIGDLLKSNREDLSGLLPDLLYRMNFNSLRFISWYQEKIRQEVSVIKEERHRCEHLHHRLSKFKKAPYRKKKIQFDTGLKSTAQLMYAFVGAEIHELEMLAAKARKEKAAAEAVELAKAKAKKEAEAKAKADAEAELASYNNGMLSTGYKIQSKLSVDCLAYLFRLMAEGEVIEAGVKTELTRFLASIFSSPGTAANGISADSFYRKWRDPVHTNAMITKAALTRMIKIIDTQF